MTGTRLKPPWAIGVFILLLLLGGASLHWSAVECRLEAARLLVFDEQGSSCVVVVSPHASVEERRAARLIQRALSAASGMSEVRFPIMSGEHWRPGRRVIEIRVERRQGGWEGNAARAARYQGTTAPGEPGGLRAERVEIELGGGRAVISAGSADAIEAAAAWFLESKLGARWVIPGALGEVIPRRRALTLEPGRWTAEPSFVSRNLGLAGGADETDWWRRNRLRVVFHHGHAMSELFPAESVRRQPDLAPMVNGGREFPAPRGSPNWQPNLAAPGAVEQAVAVLSAKPALSSAIGMNDSIRYDQSAATLAKVGPPRWFRGKPDYSNHVFGFVNEVAKRVPRRYLGAYAYDWTEDTPAIRIERNVVPFLTADRSQWFDPAFAAEDQALIRRWVGRGGEFTGIYDYYYGAPFLVPRPTVYAVARSIPFVHAAGVRAFYAETYPNWGLDGPKPWLAAQLLWDATLDPEQLLATYYREYWAEATGPMKRFFELCDRQWLEQPLPSYWIKYYKDEHQYLLFPSGTRNELHGMLADAAAAARSPTVQQRVEMTRAAFAVTEAFCRWCETRDELARLLTAADTAKAPPFPEVADLVGRYGRELRELESTLTETKQRFPLALQAGLIGEYTRNDPRRKAVVRLLGPKNPLGALPPDLPAAFHLHSAGQLSGRMSEQLTDPGWVGVQLEFTNASTNLDWVRYRGGWWGHGEPFETRRIAFTTGWGGRGLRFDGCKHDTLEQSRPATPGSTYLAAVQVRGKVSPGNMTFLILNFADAAGKPLGVGFVDRLPVGDFSKGVELATWAVAPAGAKRVGVALRVVNQVNDDFAEFAQVSLRLAEGK